MLIRDKCWLSKEIKNSKIKSFKIEDIDNITKTIIDEFSLLFPSCVRSTNQESSVRFELCQNDGLGKEGFEIVCVDSKYKIVAQSTQGLLYGFYRFYSEIAQGNQIEKDIYSVPDQKIRMLNHWDNFDGSVERGYAGESIFYKDNKFRKNYETIKSYARLLASIGINAISLNNVNVHKEETHFITEKYLFDIKEIVDIFKQYGIKTFLSINFAAPMIIGDLKTADPLDMEVRSFWKQTAKLIYSIIPDFGGFVVKADSEGEPGPFEYGRDHDDGANMLAEALVDYDGLVIWRCFVYNCLQDWRDRTIDRAKAAYDNFLKLDGLFSDNVILQIKNGPIDFQVREPVSPLFGALKNTNHILEFQITQEYTGQQKHICYLLPMWKDVLDFDTKYDVKKPYVKDIIHEQSPNTNNSGIAAVVNVGIDSNWTGHSLAQANLYGYGQLIWNNQLTSEEIAESWLNLTYNLSEFCQETLKDILLTSYETYEDYTAPLGIGFMVRPNHHYGPDVDGYEYDRWGTYHFADRNGIGVDRTLATGTGYTRQYSDTRFSEYENLETCPDNLILFFHHLPYDYELKNGKTLIQHIYDMHFAGYDKVEEYVLKFKSLKSELDSKTYENVTNLLQEQKQSARDWKDQINTYFYRKSGIKDELNRQIYS